jgi:predicted amino acid-binding ACT domain protein
MASIIKEVAIIEEEEGKETGGRFRAEKMEVSVGASVGDYSNTYSYPTDRALLAAEVDVATEWIGDEVSVHVSPDTIIGTLTSESAASATIHDVSQSVIDNIALGFIVSINGEDLGECIAIDTVNLKITTQTSLAASAPSSTPVKITIIMADHVPMTAAVSKIVGESKIGASHLPANTVVKVIYHNLTGGSARTFKKTMETLY